MEGGEEVVDVAVERGYAQGACSMAEQESVYERTMLACISN